LVCFETHFEGSMPPLRRGPEDAVIWPDGPRIGKLVLLPQVRPEAIDFAANRFPAIRKVALGGQSEHAAKLALLYDLERVSALLRDGNEPFYADRDRAAFDRFLNALKMAKEI
jgi:hypothetical protein